MTSDPSTAAAVRLSLRVGIHESGGLRVSGIVANETAADVYVLDGVWTFAPGPKAVLDSRRAYRFVESDVLQVLVGVPPLPEDRLMAVWYIPFASRVRPGATRQLTIDLDDPTTEYSCYFNMRRAAVNEVVTVRAMELVVHYLTEIGESSPRQSLLGEEYFDVSAAAAKSFAVLRSERQPVDLRVVRYLQGFPRP